MIVDNYLRDFYQWLADMVYSYFPEVSPWLMAKHMIMGGLILFTMHFAVADRMAMFGFFSLLSVWVITGAVKSCNHKHEKWLNGEEVLPEAGGTIARMVWLVLSVSGLVMINLTTVASPIALSGLYFYACGSPTNIRSRKLAHAGI